MKIHRRSTSEHFEHPGGSSLTCIIRFMGSEADLDTDVKALSILSEHPELYQEFAKLGCVSSLVSLLSHENTDIAIDAIETINELTDEDVEAKQDQWDFLVDALLDADLLNLLFENVLRLNEDIESDRAGIYHVLSLLENLSSRLSIIATIGKETKFLGWLLSRIQQSESSTAQNTQYSAEILAILLQSSPANRSKLILLNGIDIFLQLLSPYRKRDPAKGTEEEEYVENVFDCLTCCVDDSEGKAEFLEAEGLDLCLIMLRDGKMSKPRALRLLDHALGGPNGVACCERLVEAAGLKPTFGLFMKRQDSEATEHLLGIFSSMLRSLPANEVGFLHHKFSFLVQMSIRETSLIKIEPRNRMPKKGKL
jgi:beta-catenin-like protein 1